MRKMKSFKWLLSCIAVIMIAAGCSSQGSSGGTDSGSSSSGSNNAPKDESGFPQQLAVSVYDVGSSGYAEFSAVANALTSEYGTQIRLIPSGTGVGRMIPMKDGVTPFGRLGDEYQFAYRGEQEFATMDWGPQDLRVVWQTMTHINGAVLEKSDIKTPADLKGKKIPYITANASINTKVEAVLAAGGLTWDDVEKVELTGYAAQADALKQGQTDMALMLPGASSLIELDEMQGIRWLELSDDVNSEEWKNVQKVVPWLVPDEWSVGAGLSKDEPLTFMAYPYPLVSRADVDEEVVYELIKRLDNTIDQYKDATPGNIQWSKDRVNTTPLGVPFHEGTIRFLEEEGMWSEEQTTQNNELIEYGKSLKEEWEKITAEAEEQNISKDDFPQYWLENKSK